MRISLLVIALLALTVPAGAYPTAAPDGTTVALDEASYRSFTSPKESTNDLVFYGKKDKPGFKTLTATEKLMAGGTFPGPGYLRPYYMYIFDWAAAFYEKNGSIPAVLDPATIKNLQKYPDLEMLRNPLTGKWPRLDAKSPSPGDFYVRAVTTDELHHLAKFNPDRDKMWFHGLYPDGGQHGTKLGCVLYIRMYGLHVPLMATYITSMKD